MKERKHSHALASVVVVIVVIVAGFLISQTTTGVDSTGRVHVDLYEGADDLWEARAEVSAFNEQIVDGDTIGSSSALSLSWSKPVEDFNHYVVTVTGLEGVLRTEASEKDRPRLDLTGLESETTYTFAVQACVDRHCEQWLIADTEPSSTTSAEVWVENPDAEDGSMNLLNP